MERDRVVGTHPIELDLDAPLEVDRWRPFFAWVPAIPHLLILCVAGEVIGLVAFVGWIVALFTGRVPDVVAGTLTWYQRYGWRVLAYAGGLRNGPWPAFDFTLDVAEPGGDPATLVVPAPAEQGRLGIFFRWLLVLPNAVVFAFVAFGAWCVWGVGCFVVLFTGAWPPGMRDFLVGTARWGNRLTGYAYLLTDRYPPYSTAP